MRLASPRLVLLALSSILVPSAHAQTDWFVDAAGVPPGTGTSTDPYTSIQFGLAQATTLDGDRLLVASGTYSESVDFQGKNVVVTHDGVGPLPHIVGDGVQSAVRFVSGETDSARLVRFAVTGSVPGSFNNEPGGGILVDGATPVLEEVVVHSCTAGTGGGIAVLSGGLTLEECQVLENMATGPGGGILIESGELMIQGGEIRLNVAENASGGGGGGLAALEGSTVTVQGTLIESNRLGFGRGNGIYALGTIALDDVEIRSNRSIGYFQATGGGGGIYAPLAMGTNCLIQGNGDYLTNNAGGGAWGGTWVDSVFRDNHTCGSGGGLHEGNARNCLFEGNLTECDDSVGGSGGGASKSVLVDCLILENVSRGDGGGTSDCILERCIVRNNQCTGGFFGSGGGVSLGSATDCLIEGNKVIPGGDPFQWAGGASNADLLRCIVRGNLAPDGGAVYGGTVDRCTIVHNLATGQPFIMDESSVVNATVTNSILWGNEPVELRSSNVTYSNVQDSTPGVGNFSSDPQLYGPGSDVHLLAISPCIDAGDPAAAPDLDGSRADVGALPFDPLHRRENGPFCFGLMDLEVEGELSVSSSTAILTSPGAVAFVVGVNANYTPRVFYSPNSAVEASGLCLVSPLVRVFPSSSDQLALTPALLSSLGLAPGDRVFVQAYRNLFGPGVETSPGLDLLVLP